MISLREEAQKLKDNQNKNIYNGRFKIDLTRPDRKKRVKNSGYKKYLILLVSTLLLIFISSISYSKLNETKSITQDINIDEKLRSVATPNYLENKILYSLNKDDIDNAIIYKNLAEFLHLNISAKTLQRLEDENTIFKQTLRNSQKFTNGLIYGNSSANQYSMAGSIISDMTIVGDLRDTYIEGSKYINNQEYDKFTLYSASIGLALSATTILTVGSTIGAKVAVSILKVAKKSGNLSNSFTKVIYSKLLKSADFTLLRNINFNSFNFINKIDFTSINSLKSINFKNMNSEIITSIRKPLSAFSKSINLKYMKNILDKISLINKESGSIVNTVKLMKYVDNEKDLTKMIKISNRFKNNTIGVFKILGKGILHSGKVVVKVVTKTTKIIIYIINIILWGIYSLFMIFFIFFKQVNILRSAIRL